MKLTSIQHNSFRESPDAVHGFPTDVSERSLFSSAIGIEEAISKEMFLKSNRVM